MRGPSRASRQTGVEQLSQNWHQRAIAQSRSSLERPFPARVRFTSEQQSHDAQATFRFDLLNPCRLVRLRKAIPIFEKPHTFRPSQQASPTPSEQDRAQLDPSWAL
jgi:hypothetical protein